MSKDNDFITINNTVSERIIIQTIEAMVEHCLKEQDYAGLLRLQANDVCNDNMSIGWRVVGTKTLVHASIRDNRIVIEQFSAALETEGKLAFKFELNIFDCLIKVTLLS